jgi:hypothetical protein
MTFSHSAQSLDDYQLLFSMVSDREDLLRNPSATDVIRMALRFAASKPASFSLTVTRHLAKAKGFQRSNRRKNKEATHAQPEAPESVIVPAMAPKSVPASDTWKLQRRYWQFTDCMNRRASGAARPAELNSPTSSRPD